MKIAVLSPITWRTPPQRYGPWEQVASVLTEALVANGIDATLFATGDSITRARLQWICERPTGESNADNKVWECLHISNLMEQAESFDLIHNHFDFLPLTYSRLIACPMITTIHGFSSEQIIPVYKKYNKDSYYVSISNSDRHPSLNYLDTVYNGVDDTQLNMGEGQGDYLLYFSRIHPHKGAYESIQIAKHCKKRLLLCGLIQDQDYFEEKVRPFLDDETIIYKGNVGPAERNVLMGGAIALLHPVSFEEPFGLSVAEAMMCGTPVVAFNRGSMEELIIDKKTGFLVNDTEGAIKAIQEIGQVDRRACREYALSNFSSRAMAMNYIRLYKQVLNFKSLS